MFKMTIQTRKMGIVVYSLPNFAFFVFWSITLGNLLKRTLYIDTFQICKGMIDKINQTQGQKPVRRVKTRIMLYETLASEMHWTLQIFSTSFETLSWHTSLGYFLGTFFSLGNFLGHFMGHFLWSLPLGNYSHLIPIFVLKAFPSRPYRVGLDLWTAMSTVRLDQFAWGWLPIKNRKKLKVDWIGWDWTG